MSLTIAREVNAKHPHLLKENTGASCHMFTVHLIEHLRVAGFSAFLMCKTRGEGQYTPLGFQPRDVMGFDGKMYRVTGVSHDAIWCEGRQFDTIGSANDGDTPIFRPNGEQIVGVPVWNPIPQEYWRPNNPPLIEGLPIPDAPQPPRPAPVDRPGREEMMNAGAWLDAYYRSPDGLQRPEGLSKGGVPDWEGVGAWLFDVYFMGRLDGLTEGEARAKVIAQIRNSDEWKGKHP